MASSASSLLLLEIMAQTEDNGTWGDKTSTNLKILEAAITGVFPISTTGGSIVLANANFTVDDAKNRELNVTGALTSDATITVPNLKRTFRVNNRTSGGFAVKIKTSSGSSISVTQGAVCDVVCDGSNGMTFGSTLTIPSTGAPATAGGAAASAVSFTPAGNTVSTNVQAAISELQGDIDTINASLISSYQPLAARLTDLSSVAATKGNVYVGNGTSIVALGVGTDGFIHVADSASTTGTKWSALVPVGSVSLWYQAAAPTGWTVSNADNDKAIRIVNGTGGLGGSAAGTTSFSSVMTARTPTGTVAAHTLTLGEIPSHNHDINTAPSSGYNRDASDVLFRNVSPTSTNPTGLTISNAGGGGSHSHGWTGDAMDFAVQYCNVIKAAKAAY